MSSPRVVDLSHARSAFKARDAEAFSRGIAPLRVDLTLEGLVRYVASVQDKDWGAFEIVEAVAIALREPSRFGFIHFIERISVLAVALEGHVVVAMQPSKKSQPFPKSGWQMGRWFKDPEKNRPTVEAWARDPARHKDALFVRFEAGASAADDRGEALLADVLARPDDDAPRLVYADWLMERGDKLGDWIAVEVGLARDPNDKKLLARKKALTRTHADRAALLGPLSTLGDDPVFDRGILRALTFRNDDKNVRPVFAHPRLSTVVAMNVWWIEHEQASALLQTPSLRSLRTITHAKWETFALLAKRAAPMEIETLEADLPDEAPEPDPELADARGLPALRTLRMEPWSNPAPGWLLDGALGKRLTRIECSSDSVRKWRHEVQRRGLTIQVAQSEED